MGKHFLALTGALALHVALLLFGGLLLFREAPKPKAAAAEVELFGDENPAKPDPEKEKKEAKKAESKEAAEDSDLRQQTEAAPDVRDLARLEAPANYAALAPLSLSDLEGALGADSAADGAFAEGMRLSSGGRIGGTGTGEAIEAASEAIASVAELDQRPRAILQIAPGYPAELRGRKVQGTVEVVFLVDTEGRVKDPKVAKSTNPGFEKPALDAVRQWKFEAGTRNGQRVPFKMRIPIAFSMS